MRRGASDSLRRRLPARVPDVIPVSLMGHGAPYLGHVVAALGDVNRDGFSDYAVMDCLSRPRQSFVMNGGSPPDFTPQRVLSGAGCPIAAY